MIPKRVDQIDTIPLSNYRGVDWKAASHETFIEMYWPRGPERGNIYDTEASLMLDVCLKELPTIVLEIGVMFGTSTRLFGAITKRTGGHVVSIDGGMEPTVETNMESLGFSHVILLKEWSPWIPFHLSQKIDFLFIDGDHSFMSVICDYHYFNYFLKTGGIIAFHDINLEEVQRAVDVARARDKFIDVCSVDRLLICKKVAAPGEVYFEGRERV